MSLTSTLFFIAGLILLIAGAEALVRGASKLAVLAGISPLVIGLTIVAVGTSSPELAVSFIAALSGNADISLGNVVGSNIFNILLILGISASIAPLVVSKQLIRFDIPVMITVSILVFIFGLDGKIGRLEGISFFIGIVSYTVFLIYKSRRLTKYDENNPLHSPFRKGGDYDTPPLEKGGRGGFEMYLFNLVLILIGLFLLILGSRWLVAGAVIIAKTLGVSELIIGLTIVAAGTSLPEVATSVVATIRGERDIAVGNVVGSNIFNILAVLGLSSIASLDGIKVSPIALHFDIPVMIAVAIICLPVFLTRNLISRWEGIFLLGCYGIYLLYLISLI